MLASPKYPFEEWAICGAPEERGIYALYARNEILCIGVAEARMREDTIRARLEALAKRGAGAAGVSHYQWEICFNPAAKRQYYLQALVRALPFCEVLLGELRA